LRSAPYLGSSFFRLRLVLARLSTAEEKNPSRQLGEPRRPSGARR
jgi:hypothetical protein